jgi:2Fe-2S ferredoxin
MWIKTGAASRPFSYVGSVRSTALTRGRGHPYNARTLFGQVRLMPRIIFVLPDGERREVEVENGYSVMEAAINNNIDGIVAECGGACACATCHSYIDEAWIDKMPEMDDMEDSMLDAAYDRRDNSRLTCQLEMNDAWDGLVVHVAENEY